MQEVWEADWSSFTYTFWQQFCHPQLLHFDGRHQNVVKQMLPWCSVLKWIFEPEKECFIFNRKKFALPEDIEYFNIQLQMNYDLFDEYKEVERIIGKF